MRELALVTVFATTRLFPEAAKSIMLHVALSPIATCTLQVKRTHFPAIGTVIVVGILLRGPGGLRVATTLRFHVIIMSECTLLAL